MPKPDMRRLSKSLLLPVLVGLTMAGECGWAQASRRSERNANYRIEVELDPASRTLAGRQVLRWRNLQDDATRELWFHLYWNAWRNNASTWMREDRYRKRSSLADDIRPDDWGWIEVDKIELLSGPEGAAVDLMPSFRYAAPDDGNADDRTVAVVDLPAPVPPAAEIEVRLEWRAKVPRTFARTGFRGDFYLVAHWFPTLGVYEENGWNCHQFHASTEFYSDYGVYDVAITVPQRFVVGATGRQEEVRPNGDGTTTHRFRQEDVHAFTWTASPEYQEILDRFEVPGLPSVDLRLLIQPEHARQIDRHLYATKAALASYGSWYGPYPYDQLTIVDPAYGSGAGGMEYPTLFTAGTRLFNPYGGGSPESVTIHEAGHQFWYGLVGNDEFEHAWLDEGLNTFSTNRTMWHTYGPRQYVARFFKPPATERSGFFALLLPGVEYGRSPYDNRLSRYRELADIDRQDTPSYLYFPTAGGALSYSKTALWLGTLERYLGWERLQPAMALFFERWRFGHPEPEDFIAALEESTGEPLGWFFDAMFRSSKRFDYAIEQAWSVEDRLEGRVEGAEGNLVPAAAEALGEVRYHTEVVVRRRGGGVFPVDIRLVFEDGSEILRHWQGSERWHRIVEKGPVRLAHVEVDPEDVLLLDLDRTNNSLELESTAAPVAVKWATRWFLWLQDLLTTMSFFG